MNILFFLIPKSEVIYIREDETLWQAMEKMDQYQYTSVPIIGKNGRYIGTLTQGDILHALKAEYAFNILEAKTCKACEIKRHQDNRAVHADANMESLVNTSLKWNFVPVIDDEKCFIGIVTRRDIIKYFYKKSEGKSVEED